MREDEGGLKDDEDDDIVMNGLDEVCQEIAN